MELEKLIEFLEVRLIDLKKMQAKRQDQDLRFLKEIYETIGRDFPLWEEVAETTIEVIEPEPEKVLAEYEGPWVVRLYEFGKAKNKLSIVKAVCDAGGFPGLKEAKDACDKAALELVPVLITEDRKKADELCELITEYGAKYSLTNQ